MVHDHKEGFLRISGEKQLEKAVEYGII